jgi:hypothetical protein
MVRRKKKKLTEIAFDIYRELYANSEPKADFDLLLESAEIMPDGRKNIHYENYEIDGELMDDIVERHLKENKLKPNERQAIKLEIYLGASPMTKRIREDNEYN